VKIMTCHAHNGSFSAYHVALSHDLFLQGGFLEIGNGKVVSWPWLHMHVYNAGIAGAIWADSRRARFLLVSLDPQTCKMKRVGEMSAAELEAFKVKNGVFWSLA
jgi:hypothetical protein